MDFKRIFLFFSALAPFLFLTMVHASNLSFSARLVNADGSPVTGTADLRFEVAYSVDTSLVECSSEVDDVALSSGVFHVNLNFSDTDCGTKELSEVLAEVPENESVMLRVIDRTDPDELKEYPFQALNSVPSSVLSEKALTLVPMDAELGEVLKWDGSKWAPDSDEGEDGTVTQIEAGDGLAGGVITESGIISIDDDGVTSVMIDDGTIKNVDIGEGEITYSKLNLADNDIEPEKVNGLGGAAFANIGMEDGMVLGASDLPSCAANEKLRKVESPVKSWTCESDSTGTDDTKLPLLGGTMGGGIDMDGNAIENVQAPLEDGDAATKKYVDDGLADKADAIELDNYVALAGDDMTGPLQMNAQNEIRFADADSSNYVSFKAPDPLSGNVDFILPGADGAGGEVLSTDGSGNLTWVSSTDDGSVTNVTATAPLSSTEGTAPEISIMQASGAGDGYLSSADWNTFNDKEDDLGTGTVNQYLDENKSWQDLNTDAVEEGTRLYFTTGRARGAAVENQIVDGVEDIAPSQNIVFNELASKADANDLDNYVLRAGDSMSGDLDMGTNTVSNLAVPSLDSDASTKKYVDDGLADKADATELDNYVALVGDDMTGPLQMNAQNQIRFADADSTNYVSFKAPDPLSGKIDFILPSADGASGEVLSTDGAGNLTWVSSTDDGSVTDVTATAPLSSTEGTAPEISITQASGADDGYLSSTDWNTFNDKEGDLGTGTANQYLDENKSWQDLDTDAVEEGSRLYFTDSLARAAAVEDQIVDGVTNRAPSQNIVFDELALKADASDLDDYVLKAGDTMAGALNLPADGLNVGSGELVVDTGKVGIGIAVPQRKLHVGHAGPNDLLLENTTDTSSLHLRTDNNGNAFINNMNDFVSNGITGNALFTLTGQDGIRFNYGNSGSSGTEAMRVDDAGNIGIGTSSPTSALEVEGDIKITGRVIQSSSPTSSLPVNTAGLAAYWNFQDGEAADHSGNNNTGDLRDADPGNADGNTPPYILESREASSLWCDGVDDYLHIESSPSLNITSSSFTYDGWIFWNGEELNNAFLNKESQYEIRIGPGGVLSAAFSTEDNDAGWNWVNSTWSVPTGRWVHVGITYDGTDIGYWGDGRKVGTEPNTTTGPIGTSSEALRLCARQGNDPASGFQSLAFDEVRIWNRLLTASEFYRLAAGTPVGR